MPVGFWVFPWDIEDDGIDRFAARLEELGVTSASPSVLYHSGRALLPRAREHKVRLLGGPGANYPFESLEAPFAGMESESAPRSGKRFWQRLAEALSDRGIRLDAWAMPMHGSELGRRLPLGVVRNCFGNPYSYALCPSHPQARRFAESLVGELARSQIFGAISSSRSATSAIATSTTMRRSTSATDRSRNCSCRCASATRAWPEPAGRGSRSSSCGSRSAGTWRDDGATTSGASAWRTCEKHSRRTTTSRHSSRTGRRQWPPSSPRWQSYATARARSSTASRPSSRRRSSTAPGSRAPTSPPGHESLTG